jgi:hypothetical protein
VLPLVLEQLERGEVYASASFSVVYSSRLKSLIGWPFWLCVVRCNVWSSGLGWLVRRSVLSNASFPHERGLLDEAVGYLMQRYPQLKGGLSAFTVFCLTLTFLPRYVYTCLLQLV